MHRRILSVLAVAVAMVSASACSSPAPAGEDESSLDRMQETGVIRAAFITAPPLTFINDETGQLDGSGPAVLGAIMSRLGVDTVEPVLADFDGIIPGLSAGRWDISAWPFYVTPERCASTAFTNPTAQYLEGAMVQTGNPLGIASYEDLARPEVRIAIGVGNAEIQWAKDNGATDAQISLFSDEALALEALRNGQVDVYLNSHFGMVQALRNYDPSGLEIADPFTGPIVDGEEVVAYGAWAVRVEDTELREAFNAELKKLNESGALLELQAPFGYDELSIPDPTITSASLCPEATWAR